MKKLMIFLITIIGIILIIIGITIGVSILNNPTLIEDKIEPKKATLNTMYQQQLILNIEESLQNGYQLEEGKSTEKSTTFLDSKQELYRQYKDCNGEINFLNINNTITYELNTKCKKDTGNLNIKYKVMSPSNIKIESPKLYETKNGYFIVGVSESNTKMVFLKFNDEDELEFVSDYEEEQNSTNSSAYVIISDIHEEKDGYYILGYSQGTKEEISEGFSFLLKYNKKGNLIFEKLIDKNIAFDGILGRNGNELIITNNSRIAKYNIDKDIFRFDDISERQIDTTYLKNNFIYGYGRACNYNSSNNEWNKNALIKLDLSGKTLWSKNLEYEEKIKENTCSDYVSNVYNLGKYNAIVYDNSKKISIYNENGKQMKMLNYSKLQKEKDMPIIIYNMKAEDNKIKIFFDNNEDIVVDTYNNRYKLINRYATNLYTATISFDFIENIANITSKKDRFTQIKMLVRNKPVFIRIEYIYE